MASKVLYQIGRLIEVFFYRASAVCGSVRGCRRAFRALLSRELSSRVRWDVVLAKIDHDRAKIKLSERLLVIESAQFLVSISDEPKPLVDIFEDASAKGKVS